MPKLEQENIFNYLHFKVKRVITQKMFYYFWRNYDIIMTSLEGCCTGCYRLRRGIYVFLLHVFIITVTLKKERVFTINMRYAPVQSVGDFGPHNLTSSHVGCDQSPNTPVA